MKSYFPVVGIVVSSASKKRNRQNDNNIEANTIDANAIDVNAVDVDNNIEVNANIDGQVDNDANNDGQDDNDDIVDNANKLLSERVTIHNVVVQRELEQGVPSPMISLRTC